jgi:hypothetical protein
MAWTPFAAGIFTAGQILTAAQMNTYVRDNLTFLAVPNMARARSTTATSIPTTTVTALPLAAAESYDTATMHDTAVNTSRVITRVAGVFSIVGTLQYAGTAGGSFRLAIILKNGVEMQSASFPIAGGARCNISIMDYAALATDYYELAAFQDSGGAVLLDSIGVNPETASLSVTYMGATA